MRACGCGVCALCRYDRHLERKRKEWAKQYVGCKCGLCATCRETTKIERLYNERYGAEMEFYYSGLRVAPGNSFHAIERAYYYCQSLD